MVEGVAGEEGDHRSAALLRGNLLARLHRRWHFLVLACLVDALVAAAIVVSFRPGEGTALAPVASDTEISRVFAGLYPSLAGQQSAAYEMYLDKLDQKCREDRQQIARMVTATHELARARGVQRSLNQIADQVYYSLPDNTQTVECDGIFALVAASLDSS